MYFTKHFEKKAGWWYNNLPIIYGSYGLIWCKIPLIIIHSYYIYTLVGGAITILKNIRVRQLGKDYPFILWKIKVMFQSTGH